jgi:hypothetical protein
MEGTEGLRNRGAAGSRDGEMLPAQGNANFAPLCRFYSGFGPQVFTSVEFVLSHPFSQESGERMGHGRFLFERSET